MGEDVRYSTIFDPLLIKLFCEQERDLDWLRKERTHVAMNQARSLELWLMTARAAVGQNEGTALLAFSCDFDILLEDTEWEIEHNYIVTCKLHNMHDSAFEVRCVCVCVCCLCICVY